MQNLQIIQGCIYFQAKHFKYLYGMTYTFLLNSKLAKIKPDYLIIPSSFYKALCYRHAEMQQILAMKLTKAEGPQIKENQFTPLVRQILGSVKQLIIINKGFLKHFKIPKLKEDYEACLDYYSDHEVREEELVNALEKQNQYSQLLKNPELGENLIPNWLNNPRSQLKIIVPQSGMTTYLCLETDLVVINPTHHFISDMLHVFGNNESQSMAFNSLLHTVIISKVWSIHAALSLLLLKSPEGTLIRVIITSKRLERYLLEEAFKKLGYPEELVRKKFLVRVIGSDLKNIACKMSQFDNVRLPVLQDSHYLKESSAGNTGSLFIVHSESNPKEQPKFELHFGSSVALKSNRKIIFYDGIGVKSELNHFPQDLKYPNLQFLVCYGIKEEISKELKTLPVELRKKIILNRLEHKYNHKYFLTLTNSATGVEKGPINHCTVVDIQAYQIKEVVRPSIKVSNPGSKVEWIPNEKSIDGIRSFIKVERGVVYFQENGQTIVKDCKSQIFKAHKITAAKMAKVRIYSEADQSVQNWRESEGQQNLLANIQANSFIRSLDPNERVILGRICKVKTFQVGNRINSDQNTVYWITKGSLTWENKDCLANTGYFIGDLRGYFGYSQTMSLGNIQIFKDTWTLEMRIPEFYEHFLKRFPYRLHEIYEKGDIFS